MFSLGSDKPTYSPAKTAFSYLCVSLLVALFGAVYERFSHEVYSFYMIYAFVFPLAGGTMPFLTMGLQGKRLAERSTTRVFYHCGIATLTVGSILQGVLEIYGTSSRLIKIYWIIGCILIAASAAVALIKHLQKT